MTDKELTDEQRAYEEFLTKTFAAAETMLELDSGTLADTNKDKDFIAIMKMSSTIEPLINQALEKEIQTLRKHKIEHEGANALAAFVKKARDRKEKVRLANEMGILSDARLRFILSVYELRDHYAHNVKNFHLSIFDIIKKIETDNKKFIFDLSGLDKKQKYGEIVIAMLLRTFVYQRFAGFLSDALDVIQPPTLGLGILSRAISDLESASVKIGEAEPSE